jgi:uncharacterized membrane protein
MFPEIAMESYLQPVMGVLVVIVEAAGALVVVTAVLRVFTLFFFKQFSSEEPDLSRLRLMLGQHMIMGLEFQVAADILKTAISPTWNDILLLAALIGLRTLLNYLLEQEIEHIAVLDQPLLHQ